MQNQVAQIIINRTALKKFEKFSQCREPVWSIFNFCFNFELIR